MQNVFTALKKRINTTEGQHFGSVLLGGVVVGAVCFRYIWKLENSYYTLNLGNDAFNALVNGETDFIRFTDKRHPYVFHVTLV